MHTFLSICSTAAFTLLSAYWTIGWYTDTKWLFRGYLALRKHREKDPDEMRLGIFAFSVFAAAMTLGGFGFGCLSLSAFLQTGFTLPDVGLTASCIAVLSGFGAILILMQYLRPRIDAFQARANKFASERVKRII